MVELFYTTYISVDLAHQVIFHAKVGKGGIMWFELFLCQWSVVKFSYGLFKVIRLFHGM